MLVHTLSRRANTTVLFSVMTSFGFRKVRVTLIILIVTIILFIQVHYLYKDLIYPQDYNHFYHRVPYEGNGNYPVLVDWHNHFVIGDTELRTFTIDSSTYSCVMTKDRSSISHNIQQAIMFYGTDFDIEDLPLPRKSWHIWSVQHEESPKNNILFSFEGIMKLFNYTSTFRRESHFPITTQYLRSIELLESRRFLKSFKEKSHYMERDGLAPIIYVQSDCDVPSDRDNLIKMMSKYIQIDSYGSCLHNKDLPSHLKDPMRSMATEEFVELISKYKFAVAMENGICQDYITEKFWRPLVAGAIPIVLGSPKIQDYSPDNHSIIEITNFTDIKQITSHIAAVSNNENSYELYRWFKSKGVLNHRLKLEMESRLWETDTDILVNSYRRKPNYPELYQAKLCQAMHLINQGAYYQANRSHYGCPWPDEFYDEHNLSKKRPFSHLWHSVWKQTKYKVESFLQLTNGGLTSFNISQFKLIYDKKMSESIHN